MCPLKRDAPAIPSSCTTTSMDDTTNSTLWGKSG